MSIERPSEAQIESFAKMMEQKNTSGDWRGMTPYMIAFGGVVGYFMKSLVNSANPYGVVPRMLYENSLPYYKRHFRHLKPFLIIIGGMYLWDVHIGTWATKKDK